MNLQDTHLWGSDSHGITLKATTPVKILSKFFCPFVLPTNRQFQTTLLTSMCTSSERVDI
uniref:Uncharacterized protein n=1 Tax=Anguilla anguilla TaxID=7936 RepID=A0A0E9SL73_ANGAN